MKKIAIMLTALALLSSNVGHAQSTKMRSSGSAATAGTYNSNNFAWGIGLGALIVLGVVVGITAGAASSSPSSSSH